MNEELLTIVAVNYIYVLTWELSNFLYLLQCIHYNLPIRYFFQLDIYVVWIIFVLIKRFRYYIKLEIIMYNFH